MEGETSGKVDWGKTQRRRNKLRGLFYAMNRLFCKYNTQIILKQEHMFGIIVHD
ncbi:hypothetical protein DSOL_2949 [Desulfosporosinus metallidurans]|uniref:Uncharacterized protein n=1 Tax=Desulfosporosinus metallidurans TaxID=1888891 RepID=A0A1Q8QTE9_9FIRM|nr:hypothetical protein DSOL_2949 [Desulfosporosinus metallidurans]